MDGDPGLVSREDEILRIHDRPDEEDADILGCSRDPTLETGTDEDGTANTNAKRVRKWSAAGTAIGPRELGGLSMQDWSMYVDGVKAHWVHRYLGPGEASWKHIWDHFILNDALGRERYLEGRGILLQKLSTAQKAKLISSFPKKATYARGCLHASAASRCVQ